MFNPITLSDLIAAIQFTGLLCQLGAAVIAAAIGAITLRLGKRQNARARASTMASESDDARHGPAKPHDFVAGYPDDAALFLYINCVHNTFRMHQIGSVDAQVWEDTLEACISRVRLLRRDQVVRVLASGYQPEFRAAVLAHYDESGPATSVLAPRRLRPSEGRSMQMAG